MFHVAPTPLDLRFRLLGFPVLVSPWFWLSAVFLGWRLKDLFGPEAVLLWVACMFASILLHELGHALMYRAYGVGGSQVVLHGFGGFCQAERDPASRWRRIAVSLAGPGIQFLFLLLLVASNRSTGWAGTNTYTILLYAILYQINLYWPLFNLLPIWPLDGGQVSRELFHILRIPKPEVRSLALSLATALFVGVGSLLIELNKLPPELARWVPFHLDFLGIVFMGFLAFASYQRLQQVSRAYDWDDGPYDREGRWRP